MDAADLAFAGLAGQAALLRAGEVCARELVDVHLERIERLDPRLNAFRVVFPERAWDEADRADTRRADLTEDELAAEPLLGVPVAVKDDVDVSGEVTALGTDPTGVPPAPRDSEVVRRLRAAGAIVLGKTHVPELTQWPFTESATWGVTRNPWDPRRTPGGSSGGSAAAVAAGLVGGAQGSDGAGSIRIPAACCGLFGLKPQRGRISLMPRSESWHGLAQLGPLTHTVADAALFLDAVAGHVSGDAAPAPPPPGRPFAEAAASAPPALRIAVCTRPPLPGPVAPRVLEAVEEVTATLRALGHEVHAAELDDLPSVPVLLALYLRGIHDEACGRPAGQRLERRTRTMARLGGWVTPGLLGRARVAVAQVTARLNAVFEGADVLLTPALAAPPLQLGAWEGCGALRTLLGASRFTPFTPAWNVTGQPAASVPAGLDNDGLPLAVQLVAREHEEATLLSLAAQLEAERPWADRRPPLP